MHTTYASDENNHESVSKNAFYLVGFTFHHFIGMNHLISILCTTKYSQFYRRPKKWIHRALFFDQLFWIIFLFVDFFKFWWYNWWLKTKLLFNLEHFHSRDSSWSVLLPYRACKRNTFLWHRLNMSRKELQVYQRSRTVKLWYSGFGPIHRTKSCRFVRVDLSSPEHQVASIRAPGCSQCRLWYP